MKKIVSILYLIGCVLSLHAQAPRVRTVRIYTHSQGKVALALKAGKEVTHSRVDLEGNEHADDVSLVVPAENGDHRFLLADIDSIVWPTGQHVVFSGSTVTQPVQAKGLGDDNNIVLNKQRRSSFIGTFPGTQGNNNVTFYWSDNDPITLDAGYESRAVVNSSDRTKATFVFDDADLDATSYEVYFPSRTVNIATEQTQNGANNSEHFTAAGDCGYGEATKGSDGSYSFTLTHAPAYLCFLPHIDNMPSVRIDKIHVNCTADIAGDNQLSPGGMYSGGGVNNTNDITLTLKPQANKVADFFIGHDAKLEQDSCAAYMVIKPQTGSQTFNITYYLTDTLSNISIKKQQVLSFKPVANTVYPITCNINDEDFGAVDLGLSVRWRALNIGGKSPSDVGSTYTDDATSNAEILKETVVNEWQMPTDDQRKELINDCNWTKGTYNKVDGYFVTSKKTLADGRKHRIFLPLQSATDATTCLKANNRPVETTYVDLGLTSGTLWATRNVGAADATSTGNYYAWGETTTKDSYTQNNYVYYKNGWINLGNDFDIAGTTNDAATVNMGGAWSMPTSTQLTELKDNCEWTWTTIHGVSGFKVSSKKSGNSNSIFLPATGYIFGSTLNGVNHGASYWSSTQGGNTSSYAYTLWWQSDNNSRNVTASNDYVYNAYVSGWRYIGLPVRAVIVPSVTLTDRVLTVQTETPTWKVGDTSVTLKATLTSDKALDKAVNVGFVIGTTSSVTLDKDLTEKKEQSISALGSFTATTTVTNNIGAWYRAYVTVDGKTYYGEAKHYGWELVDLGLSSGTLWCNMNVGASTPTESGNYYAWGETTTKDSYNQANYAYYKNAWLNLGTDYDIAGTSNDAATVNMGGAWKMPTQTQLNELMNSCTWTWTTIDGVCGYKITSKVTGNTNSIFLPATGYISGSTLNGINHGASYWSSTQGGNTSSYAYTLWWQSDNNSRNVTASNDYVYNAYVSGWRYIGLPVRAVIVPSVTLTDRVLTVQTETPTWKVDDATATLKASLYSNKTLDKGITVGFVIGSSKDVTIGSTDMTVNKSQTLSAAGDFSTTATITDNIGAWYRAYVTIDDKTYYGEAKHYGWEIVDLGLSSGTLWCNMNVGANTPSESGNYYAWGETSPKESYTHDNYAYYQNNKYANLGNDNYDIAGTENDAAYKKMGSKWKMPTKDQLTELMNSCTWTWTDVDGVNGYKVTSKVTGNTNSIFLPATGYKQGSTFGGVNHGASYWSSTQGGNTSSYAYTLWWQSDNNSRNVTASNDYVYNDYVSGWRYIGLPIRAVTTR